MKILNNIKSEHVISIDIETVRVKENFDQLSENYQSAWEYKNKQDGEIPDMEELSKLWEKTSSLYAEFSKVCAVSITYIHNGKLYCREIFGENEYKILLTLGTILNNIYVKGLEDKITYRLVGHASKYFDYPFLCKRYVINALDIPQIIDSTASKPWEQTNLCTNELWKMGGTGAGSSLQALCNALDIPISKVDLVGDEVGKSFFKGEYDRIGRYCSYDAIATFNVIRKFKKESIFNFDEVEYKVNFVDNETEIEKKIEIPILNKLYENNYLSDEIKIEIQNLLNMKKLTIKDKKNLRDILEGSYIRSEFMKNDDKATVDRKQKEIEEFLKTI